ncbi:MAG: hypothetical protein U9Q15_05340 [Patescibacteria group bacterium]|nr:hypothetical protein [Patescibacteria group bacterium]
MLDWIDKNQVGLHPKRNDIDTKSVIEELIAWEMNYQTFMYTDK